MVTAVHHLPSTCIIQSLWSAGIVHSLLGPGSDANKAWPKGAGTMLSWPAMTTATGPRKPARARQRGEVGDVVVAVAQQQIDWRPGIVVVCDLFEAIPGGNQQQAGKVAWRFFGNRRRDAGAQRFTSHQQGTGKLFANAGERFRCITHQQGLGRLTGTRPIARILGQDDAQPNVGKRFGHPAPVTGVTSVAMKKHQGPACRRARFAQQAAEVAGIRPGFESVASCFDDDLGERRAGRKIKQVVLKHEKSSPNQCEAGHHAQHHPVKPRTHGADQRSVWRHRPRG